MQALNNSDDAKNTSNYAIIRSKACWHTCTHAKFEMYNKIWSFVKTVFYFYLLTMYMYLYISFTYVYVIALRLLPAFVFAYFVFLLLSEVIKK